MLLAGGFFALSNVIRRRATRNDELVLTCMILHFGFVLLFFGNRFSWIYYYSILIAGIAALAARGRWVATLVFFQALIVLGGNKVKFQMNADLWRTDSPSSETFGLWASPGQRAGWMKVREAFKGHRPICLLAAAEGASILAPRYSSLPSFPIWSRAIRSRSRSIARPSRSRRPK